MYTHGSSSAFDRETFGEDLSFHIEQPVGSMSISPCGRDVVLASKEGLHIVDLDSPYSPPRYLPHRTSWEVADVQWSPFAARDFWVISTSNQKALVWNLGMKLWQDSVEFVLHAHTRAITDINFSAHNPDVLATCAVDSFVHCWDLRVPARPIISFSDWFAGATQVKWSRQVSHVIASSHDRFLRIWDDRMGAYPVRSIEAHDTKIYGIDWNRFEQNRIVTCSLDKSIKLWDCNNQEDVPERTINIPFPAWRARHTPFGWGLLAMPQRGNGDLHLYDRRSSQGQHSSNAVPAVARFEGHKGQVKEFLWRPRGTIIDGIDHREFQLVTWGTDQMLRLHRMKSETLSAIGYEKGTTPISKLKFTRQGAKYKTFRDEPTDEMFTEVFDSQTGSSPAPGQSFHSRPRGSTSVGMSKVAIPHPRGWLQGSNVTGRYGMHGRSDARRVLNPIDWMKNVKITSWSPETLGEEISQVGEKFNRVEFESADVQQRKAAISLHGPWGVSNAPIFMKVDIKFPVGYPQESAAIFNVQKTAAMTEELAGLLSTQLRTIAQTYVKRERGCVEAVLRYLLREQDMEQIVSWCLDASLEDSKMVDGLNLEDEASSDEDSVGVTNFQGASDMTTSSELLNVNVPVPLPKRCGASWADNGNLVCFFPPKAKQPTSFLDLLGTRYNDNDKGDQVFEGFGRLDTNSPGAKTMLRNVTSSEDQSSDFSDDSLLCSSSSSGSSDSLGSLPAQFFPQKAWRAGGAPLQRSRSADHSTQSALALSKSKFTTNSLGNVISIYDFSELLPSRQELAREYLVFGKGTEICAYNADVASRHGHEDISHIWRLVTLMLRDEVPLERVSNLHGSLDILAIARSTSDGFKELDRDFDLSCDGIVKRTKVDMAGRVRWGESAIGGAYLVPALLDYFERQGDIQMLAMLTCAFTEPRASNSAALLSEQQHHYHPMTMQLKAPAFSADYHPSLEVALSIIEKAPTISYASIKGTANASDTNHLLPADKAIHSKPTGPYSTGTTPPNLPQYLIQQPAGRRRSSRLSSTGTWNHGQRDAPTTTHSGPVSLSTSPETSRVSQRPHSNLAFPMSRAGVSALAPSFSQSPPMVGGGSAGNKKVSPVGSFMGQYTTAGVRSAASIFGGAGVGRGRADLAVQTGQPRQVSANVETSYSTTAHSQSMSSDDAVERARSGKVASSNLRAIAHPKSSLKPNLRNDRKRKVKLKTALHNQNMFDQDGYASVPLLDPSAEWKHRAFRASYAHLLGVWGLHTQRAEVLKFDGLLGHATLPQRPAVADYPIEGDELAIESLLPRKTHDLTRQNIEEKRGLQIRRWCNQCGKKLVAIEKNGIPIAWHCTACALSQRRSSTRTLCSICTKSISGLMTPCLNCGHVTCFACQREWLARENDANTIDGETVYPPETSTGKPCPTGCGCDCSSHQSVTVPYPPPSEDEDGEEEEVAAEVEEEERKVHEDYIPSVTVPDMSAAELLLSPPPSQFSDSAIAAIRSLSARGRSASDRGAKGRFARLPTTSETPPADPRRDKAEGAAGEVQTAARARLGDLGKRGLGVDLMRTTPAMVMLRERASNATIRRESEAEARLRRAGNMYE